MRSIRTLSGAPAARMRQGSLLLGAFLLGAAIHAALSSAQMPRELGWDERVYLGLAELWASGKADAITHRPPLLWVGLGVAHLLGADGCGVMAAVNVLSCGLLAAALTGIAIGFGRWWLGPILAALICCHDAFSLCAFQVMPELPVLAISVAGLWALLSRRYWLAGALAGIAALGRPEVLGIAGLFALWTWRREERIRPALHILLASLLVILPWTARNAVRTHRFVLIASNGAMNIFCGSAFGLRQPGFAAMRQRRPFAMQLLDDTIDSGGLRPYDFPMRLAVEAWLHRPDLILPKALHLWWGKDYWGRDVTPRGSTALLFIVGGTGIVAGVIRRQRTVWLAVGWLAWYTVVAIISFPMLRLQWMAMPGLALATLGWLPSRAEAITLVPDD